MIALIFKPSFLTPVMKYYIHVTIIDNKKLQSLLTEMSNNNHYNYTRCHFSPMIICNDPR